MNAVVAGLAEDQGLVLGPVQVDGVVAGAGINPGGGAGPGDVEDVVTRAEEDAEVLDVDVFDAVGHPEARDPGRDPVVVQEAEVVRRVARVEDVQDVAARGGSAVDRQERGDLVGRVAGVTDVDRVASRTGVYRRVTGYGLDVDFVATRAGSDVGRAAVGAFYCKDVVTGPQTDVEVLGREVVDVAAHVEAADPAARKGAGVVVHVARVVDVDLVGAAREIEGQDRADAVDDAAGGGRRRADVDDVVAVLTVDRRRACDRPDVDPVVAGAGRQGGGPGVRRVDAVGVARRPQADVDRFETGIADTRAHAEAAQCARGQHAVIDGGVTGIVDIEGVATAITVDDQSAEYRVDGAARARCQRTDVDGIGLAAATHRHLPVHRPHVEDIAVSGSLQRNEARTVGRIDVGRIGPGAGVDRQCAESIVDVHRVGAIVRVQVGRAAVRALDREGVAARSQADVQRLERAVGDASAHPQPGDRRRGQLARVADAVARVVDVQRVAAAVAIHREQRSDAVHVAAAVVARGPGRAGRLAAHVDRVGAADAVHRGRPSDGPDIDDVAAAMGVHIGHAAVRALDREHVAARPQTDIQRLDGAVGDAPAHAQPGDRRVRQLARVAGGLAGLIDVERVAATLAVDRQQSAYAVHVRDIAPDAAADVDRVAARPGVDRRRGADAPDIERIVAVVSVERQRSAVAVDGELIDARIAVHGQGIILAVVDRELVVVAVAVDDQRPARSVDGDRIVTGTRADRSAAAMCAGDGEGVARGSEIDVQRVQVPVGDAVAAEQSGERR